MLTTLGTVVICVTALAWGQPPTTVTSDNSAIAGNLRNILEDEQVIKRDPTRVLNAIQAAGSHQAVEAIPELIELLRFGYHYDWEKRERMRVSAHNFISPAERYPAAAALAEIGKPALPALSGIVQARNFDSIESRNARFTIRLIFRDDQKADEYFTNAAATASSPEAKQRLLKAVQTADEDRRLSPEDRRPPATSP